MHLTQQILFRILASEMSRKSFFSYTYNGRWGFAKVYGLYALKNVDSGGHPLHKKFLKQHTLKAKQTNLQ